VKALIVIALFAGVVHADDRVAAERYFRAGEAAYRAQSFEAAATNFEQAYKALALPEIAFSAAQAYRRQYRIDGKASHVARAIELYRSYLDKVRTGGRVADAADALAEMQHELDKLIKQGVKVAPELAAEHTQLGVNVLLGDEKATAMHEIEEGPAQAQQAVKITIDGKDIAPSTPMNVAPGTHAVHVEAEGYMSEDRPQKMTQGEYQMIDVTLRPLPAKLAIATDDGARISIDGRPAATGSTVIEVPAGKHLLAILRDGREPFARELVVTRGAQLRLDEPLHVTWKRRTFGKVVTAGIVTGTLAVGTMLTAIIADTSASHIHDHLVDASPDTGARYDRDIRIRDAALYATYAFAGAIAVLGVTAALLYYTDKPSLEGVHVEPVATPGRAGVAITGRF